MDVFINVSTDHMDLGNRTLSDLYGSLISEESHIAILKNQVGGPFALVGKASEGNSQKQKASKKKNALVAESDDEKGNSEGEVGLKNMTKTLSLITINYNRGFRRPSYRGPYEREDRRRSYEKRTEEKREEKDEIRDKKRIYQRSDGRGK